MSEPPEPPVTVREDARRPGTGSSAPETALRTFLIADIRGYTTYTREHGDEAGAALASQFGELVAEVATAREGFLVELRGDEALVMFVSARSALRAAIELQARFVEAALPRGVGIGLDAGEAIPVGDGFRGTALNLAARLCAAAGPGETLASETVIHLAAKIDGIAYIDPRALRLKGYSDSVRVVDVVPAERARGRRRVLGRGWRDRDWVRPAVVAIAALLLVAQAANMLGRAGSAAPTGSASLSNAASAPPAPLAGVDLPVLAFYDETGRLNATTRLTSPRNISFFNDGSFWILGENPKAFHRIDPLTHSIVQSIPIPVVETSGFNFDDTSLWITDLAEPRVVRIDKRTGVVSSFAFNEDEADTTVGHDVAIGAGSVWVSRPDIGQVVRLDQRTGKVQTRLDLDAWGLSFGAGGLWFWVEGRIGRIDPVTNEPAFEVALTTDEWLGNIQFAGDDAWTAGAGSGSVWRVDRSGRHTSYALPPGVGEMAATERTMWVTNANTGELTGIDLVTGDTERVIDTGHATLAVSAGGGEIMVAVGPTVEETIADLDGTVLTLATSGSPWWELAPDPALNGWPAVRQTLYLTCVALLNYPDKPAPEGWALTPEVAAGMPDVSADGRTYTFTIKPGFTFSPPSNEPVTAETFRATLERLLSPTLDDGAPGPQLYGDIVGVAEYRAGETERISGLTASDDKLTITLEQPAPDILERLALSFACPVPLNTPALRSGLNPDPPIGGAGPYYLAETLRRRLVILKKNPNYHGPRPQPVDAIAIRMNTETAEAVRQVERGLIDGAILDAGERISGPGSTLALEWGPGSANASAGDQRWFGAAGFGLDYIALNASRPAFADPDVRRAVSLALDRATLAGIWAEAPTDDLLLSRTPESVDPRLDEWRPDLAAATALMKGRTMDVTMMGYPTEWECGQCRDFELAIVGQLQAIGLTVTVLHEDDFPADAFEPGSDVDLIALETGSEIPDPVARMLGLNEVSWLGEAHIEELGRMQGLSGDARTDAAEAFARRLVDDESLIIPTGYFVQPFLVSEGVGCAFVQPAIGAVDLLSLCLEDGGAASSASPGP